MGRPIRAKEDGFRKAVGVVEMGKMMNAGVFSSNTDEWETPQDLFDKYDVIYHFTLDAAASDSNHKCPNYYTKADDGLSKTWGGLHGVIHLTADRSGNG